MFYIEKISPIAYIKRNVHTILLIALVGVLFPGVIYII